MPCNCETDRLPAGQFRFRRWTSGAKVLSGRVVGNDGGGGLFGVELVAFVNGHGDAIAAQQI